MGLCVDVKFSASFVIFIRGSLIAGSYGKGCLVLSETSKLFSTVAVPFCIPPYSEWEFLWLHIRVSNLKGVWKWRSLLCPTPCYPMDCNLPGSAVNSPVRVLEWVAIPFSWHLILVLICIFLMTYDVEHPCVCLCTTYVSSLAHVLDPSF